MRGVGSWRPWWPRAAVGSRALVVHAGGAVVLPGGLGEELVERNGVVGPAAGRARPLGAGLGEGIAERLGVGQIRTRFFVYSAVPYHMHSQAGPRGGDQSPSDLY